MPALVLEKVKQLAIRDIPLPSAVGPHDVKIAIHTVGICGSDVHYYQWGPSARSCVREPMMLGHEAAGTVVEVGKQIKDLKVGRSRLHGAGDSRSQQPGDAAGHLQSRSGRALLGDAAGAWHACGRPSSIPRPSRSSCPTMCRFADGAMVEPLAVGMHAPTRRRLQPGDRRGGHRRRPDRHGDGAGRPRRRAAARVIVSDVTPKLAWPRSLGPSRRVNIVKQEARRRSCSRDTDGWGADVVFECSGNEKAAAGVFDLLCPGGRVVFIGMPPASRSPIDVPRRRSRRRASSTFSATPMSTRAVAMLGSGKIDVKPLITDTFPFAESVKAFDFACHMRPASVKAQIRMPV